MKKSTFDEQIHSSFGLHHGDTDLHLELAEVASIDALGDEENCFSLLFRAPAAQTLPQATYALDHPHFDDLNLFLVPVGQDENGTYYEAVFNNRGQP